FPIPGNDDAARALQLYCDLVADAVLDGLTEGQAAMGVDVGAAEAPVEPSLRRQSAKAAATAPQPEPEPEPEPTPVVSEAEMTGESAPAEPADPAQA
ncbi:MAG: 30S ribosomal protein S2, partial [Caulobacteraceae bacterium]